VIGVLATVQLHDQLRIQADEIDDVSVDRLLAAELKAGEPAPAQG